MSPDKTPPIGPAPEQGDSLQFALWVEQKAGQGEDASPYLAISRLRNWGVLAVFDGMGGAGSTPYTYNGHTQTGAFIAAQLARSVVSQFFELPTSERVFSPSDITDETIARHLEERLLEAFKAEALRLDAAPSRLGGKMMRRLPTTMACISYQVKQDLRQIDYSSYWAGDSRAYLLTPTKGLQQISIDDIVSGGDALTNLLEDSPVSNCINVDVPFRINRAKGSLLLPAIFLVATDGCFGFQPTPAHFEYVLLDNLASSKSTLEWSNRVEKALRDVAGDDLSLALVAVGWPSFRCMQNDFFKRVQEIRESFVQPFEDVDRAIGEVEARRRDLLAWRDELRRSLWGQYKLRYELLLAEKRGALIKYEER